MNQTESLELSAEVRYYAAASQCFLPLLSVRKQEIDSTIDFGEFSISCLQPLQEALTSLSTAINSVVQDLCVQLGRINSEISHHMLLMGWCDFSV